MPKTPHVVTSGSSAATNRIHILEVLGNAIVGGMERHVENLITHLPSEDFRVTVLCPFESAFTSRLRAAGHDVFIAPLRDDPPWRTIEMMCTLIKQLNIDLVHAHLMNAHTVAAIAGKLAGTPTVATLHGMSLHPQEISVTRTTGSHMIVVCREAWSQAIAVGLPQEGVSLVPNGIDLTVFNPASADRSVLRNAIGIGPSDFLIGFVGRLAWEKGPDKFLKAAERILQHRPDVHFAIVGAGVLEREMTATIKRSGLEGNVHVAGIWQDTSQVYPALDLLLHTSRADAMPLTLLEAMASGVPIVAIGVGGVPELIEAGETGLLIGTNEWPGIVSEYPGDWEGVAQAALALIDHPGRLKSMAKASPRRAAALYDIRKSAAATAQIFRQLIGVERDATRLHSVS
jgi:glycosyltransferase involved in cell wall biosynthesis